MNNTVTTHTVTEFSFEDLGVNSASYFPGVSTYGTDWDAVFVGVGDTPLEAGEDALKSLYQSTTAIPATSWDHVRQAMKDLDDTVSAHDGGCTEHAESCTVETLCVDDHDPSFSHEATCPVVSFDDCTCHDEGTLQYHVALYVKYTDEKPVCAGGNAPVVAEQADVCPCCSGLRP